MSSVDDRIVNMRLNNSTFERAAAVTISTLARLKNSLNFSSSKKGLDELETSASKFNLDHIGNAVDGIGKRFSAMSIIGITALTNVVNKAINAGTQMVKAFTINPIAEGFHSYETQINAAKTIISNTGAKLPAVEAQLAQLQTYANQTVYSFQDMAQNIGTFTAAGVKLVPATMAIKGMGNTAALSGANVQQLNSAMYQMSQAMSSGVIRLQDWNSLSNANMGGQNIQKVLMATASTIKDTGPKMDAALKKYGNFRNSLTAGWLTADVFSKSMGIMAGTVDKATGKTVAFSVAQLKAKGYTEAQAKNLHRLSQAAIESATQIRTYTQLTAALKEEVGTAWGTVFKTIFGNVNGATTLFTALHNVLENAFTKPVYALNTLLKGVVKLGGRAKAIDAIKNVFKALNAVLKPIKDAFREIFPKTSAKTLFNLISRFDEFTKKLKIGADTANNLKRTFSGVFALLDIGKQIIMGVFHVIGTLFGAMTHGSGGLLKFTGNIGNMLYQFDEALKKGDVIGKFFDHLGNLLVVPIAALHAITSAIAGLFSGFSFGSAKGMSKSLGRVNDRMDSLSNAGDKIKDVFAGIGKKMQPGIDAIVNKFHDLGQKIADSLKSGNFQPVFDALNLGLLGAIVILLKKFFKNGVQIDIGGGILEKLGGVFEGLTGNLKAMQQQTKAKALLMIAGAIAILTVSVIALSLVDPKKLQNGLKAMAVGFGELLGAMKILTKIGGDKGFLKIPIIAASMDLLAVAILLLTAAVYALSRLSWQQLEKGLSAIGILLGVISAASIPLSANSSGMIRAGIGIIAISVAMNILYIAVKNFASLSWSELLRGLTAVAGSLVAIAIGVRLMPKGMVLTGLGLIEIAGALNLMYLAVSKFASLSWKDLGKGLAAMGGALTAIAIGMRLMPKGMAIQAASLVLISGALQLIVRAVQSMAKMSWKSIGTGLGALGGALAILAGGLYLMEGSLGGAAALMIVSLALAVLTPVLKSLGKMSWTSIIKGLVAIAGAFVVFGLAGLALAPVVPVLLLLGVALGLIGAAMALAGVGALAFSVAFTALAAAGAAGVAVLLSALKGMIALLPSLGENLALGLTNFIVTIGKNAPAIISAFIKLLGGILGAFPVILPKLVIALNALIKAILQVIADNAPQIIAGGIQLLMDLLHGISNNIGRIVDVVAQLIVRFLDAVAGHVGEIVAAGLNVLVKLLQGIASGIGRIAGAVTGIITAFISAIGSNLGKIVSSGTDVIVHLITGFGKAAGRVVTAGTNMVIAFIRGVSSNAVRLANAAAQTLVDFINGIADAIDKHAGDLRDAGWHLAKSILDGMTGGLASGAGSVIGKIKDIGGGLLGAASDILDINSPSKKFIKIGKSIGEGWVMGLDAIHDDVVGRVQKTGSATIDEMTKTIAGLGDLVSGDMDFNPVISPVLDLSNFSRSAGQMSGMLGGSAISPTFSYDQAKGISSSTLAAREDSVTVDTPAAPVQVTFQQTNTSPKALSTIDIYRQTKNQLSQAKSLLKIP